MPKCIKCNSCLELLVLEEAVYNYCFLCNRFYDRKTGKEENLLASAFLIKHNGKEFLLLGRASKDIESLEEYIHEVLPNVEIEIVKLPIYETKKEIVNKVIDNL